MSQADGGAKRVAWGRRIKLLRCLIGRGRISTSSAAAMLEVKKPQARADLRALEVHGVPLRKEGAGQAERWVIDETWRSVGRVIDLKDRLALMIGREHVSAFLHDTVFGEAMEGLQADLDALGASDGMDLRRRFHFVAEPHKDYSDHRETLDLLVTAIVGTRRVSFRYSAASGIASGDHRFVKPLSLVIYKRGVYLIWEGGRQHEPAISAVERISEATIHEDRGFEYPRPAEYDASTFLAGRFGIHGGDYPSSTVRIRFGPAVSAYVAGRTWMDGQRVEPDADGSCILAFEAAGRELVSFVLGFGDKAEVLAPPWLRAEVARELRAAAEVYLAEATQKTDVQ